MSFSPHLWYNWCYSSYANLFRSGHCCFQMKFLLLWVSLLKSTLTRMVATYLFNHKLTSSRFLTTLCSIVHLKLFAVKENKWNIYSHNHESHHCGRGRFKSLLEKGRRPRCSFGATGATRCCWCVSAATSRCDRTLCLIVYTNISDLPHSFDFPPPLLSSLRF